MSDIFNAKLTWKRTTTDFSYDTYSRDHDLQFGSGVELASTAAPSFKGSADRANPEEQLVGALSSCHMLTFLAIAAKKRYVVDSYEDDAAGIMEVADGKTWVTRVTLKPRVVFSGDKVPSAEELMNLHHKAHDNCFIANSVKTAVTIEPRG